MISQKGVAVIEDRLLILKIRSGNKDALDALISKYYDKIYRYTFRKTSNNQLSADLTQDIFLKLVDSIERYKFTGKFSNFIFTIATNTCTDYFRKKKLNYCEVDNLVDNLKETNISYCPRDKVIDNEKTEMIKKGLMILSESQRETVVLRFYHDMKVKDIAKITGVSLPTAKSRLKQSLDKLKLYFDKEGYFE